MSSNGNTREDFLVESKRKKSDDANAASLLRYQTLLETASDGIHIVNEKGQVVEANPAFCKMLGYTYEELLQLRVRDWDAQWPEEELSVKIGDLIRHPAVFESKHRRKDGTIIDVQINATAIELEGQKFLYASARDITESNRVKEILQQTRYNYESFFNTIDDFLWVLDLQGNIIHTNSTVLDRLGYTFEELLGKSVLLVHPPERREEAGRIVGEMLKGISEYCPVPIITKSGIQIPVETRVSLGNWNGNPVIFGVTKDISKVKLSEEKFSKLFHLNPAASGLSDLNSHQYVEVNEAFYKLLGFSKQEVIGKSVIDLRILDQKNIDLVIEKADSNGNVINVEADLRAKNGEIKHVLLSAENIYIQNEQFRFTVVNDITELKNAEKEIKSVNEELLKINSEKDKFFSIIAHDLRSPFNIFLNLTRMMEEDLQTLTKEQIQKFVTTLGKSARNFFNLLENLLEWSRFQRGIISVNPENFTLADNIAESISLVSEMADKKDIRISCEVPKDLMVFTDVKMTNSILRNLCTNAIKFTPKGGKVEISVIPLEENNVEVSIRDTGIGMNANLLDNLFKIDVNTSRKGTEGEASTGLGLILCKEFVEKLGGRLWVQSAVGNGSTFHFTLPGYKESRSKEVGNNAVKSSRNLKILIAEDDETSKLFLTLSLTGEGNEFFYAGNGVRALEICKNNPDIDLILMDIRMPEMDGYEATRQIRQFRKDVVIIAQTAHTNENTGEVQKLIDSGCNDYISKPINVDKLKKMIQKHLHLKHQE